MASGFVTKKRGKYYVVITIENEGKRERRWIAVKQALGLDRAPLSREANALLNKKLQEYGESGTVAQPKTTLDEYLIFWLDSKKGSITQATYDFYDVHIRTHILTDPIARLKIDKISTLVIQAFINRMIGKGPSARTIHSTIDTLRPALKSAVKWGLINRNPAELLDLPPMTKPEKQIWSDEDAFRFLEIIKGDYFEAFYLLVISTGMRHGELLGLTWDNVNLSDPSITVTKSLTRDKKFKEKPKTEKGRRKILISSSVADVLQLHRVRQVEQLLVSGYRNEHNAVFLTSLGTLYSQRVVLRRFKWLCAKHGLQEVDIHSLRHLHASWLLEGMIDYKTIQERLGHSRVQTTIDIYSHLGDKLRATAVDAIDQKIASFQKTVDQR